MKNDKETAVMANLEKASKESESHGSKNRSMARIVTTPLKGKPSKNATHRFRDINEDDDGYHPFCDGPEQGCEFEKDPWR